MSELSCKLLLLICHLSIITIPRFRLFPCFRCHSTFTVLFILNTSSMKQAIFCTAVLIYLLLVMASCNKNSDSPALPVAKNPACALTRITSSTPGDSTVLELTYNNDGQLSIIRQTKGGGQFTKVLSYIGNTVIAALTGAGERVDSVVLNSNGLIAFSQTIDKSIPNSPRKTVNTFTYGADGQLIKSTSQNNNDATVTTNYTFVNGDLVSTDGPGATTYTYYTDKSFIDGDFLKIFQQINHNGLFVRNKHLVKSARTGSTQQNFIYEFDSKGKITKLTGTTGTRVEELAYNYKCE